MKVQIVFWTKTAYRVDIARAPAICLFAACCVCGAAGHDVCRRAWARRYLLLRLPCVVRHLDVWSRAKGRCRSRGSRDIFETGSNVFAVVSSLCQLAADLSGVIVVPLIQALVGMEKGPKNIHDTNDAHAAGTSHSLWRKSIYPIRKGAERDARDARVACNMCHASPHLHHFTYTPLPILDSTALFGLSLAPMIP